MEERTTHIPSLNEVLHHEGTYGQDDGETLGRQLYGCGATIWDAVLACRGNDLWRDIEGTIKWFLTESQNPWKRELSPKTLIDALESPDPNGSIMSALQGEQGVGFVALGFLKAYMDKQGMADIDIDTMLVFLLEQLHSIESAFGKYLEDPPGWRIERKFAYASDAERLIDHLSSLDMPDHDENTLETSVLDFNYTMPFARYQSEHEEFYPVNIHGNTNAPIFGIDGRDLMSDPRLVRFTKTYRIMALADRVREKIVHTSTGRDGHPTDFVKFYGHSLGDADYSYFQAIFDGVDLYSSDTQLIFYYNLWQQDDGKSCSAPVAQQDMFQKVTRLMSEYGETMSNKDHGRNLMHKLLLEGRLTIKKYR